MTSLSGKPIHVVTIDGKETRVVELDAMPESFRFAITTFPSSVWRHLQAVLARPRMAQLMVHFAMVLDRVQRDSNDNGDGDGGLLSLADAVTEEDALAMHQVTKGMREHVALVAQDMVDMVLMARSEKAYQMARQYFPGSMKPKTREMPRRTTFVKRRRGGAAARHADESAELIPEIVEEN